MNNLIKVRDNLIINTNQIVCIQNNDVGGVGIEFTNGGFLRLMGKDSDAFLQYLKDNGYAI